MYKMVKTMEKHRRRFETSHFKPFSRTKIVLPILFLMIFMLIPSVSGAEFDNVKSYDSKTMTATIDNAFGFGDTLANIKLISNGCGITSCESIIELDLKTNYENPFKKLNFYNLNKNFLKHNLNYEILLDGKPYDYKTINSGVHTIKITGTIGIGDRIEWIPTFLGVDINEWAVWKSTFDTGLFAYYNFSGVDEPINTYNMNVSGGSEFVDGGKIGKYGKVNSTNYFNVSGEYTKFRLNENEENFTMAGWLLETRDGGGDVGILGRGGFAGVGGYNIISAAGGLMLTDYFSGTRLTAITNRSYGTWVHMALERNDTSVCFFINGTLDKCVTPDMNKPTSIVNNFTFGGLPLSATYDFEGGFDE